MTCAQVMSKLVRNAAVSPSEDKYKRIKLSNSKVKTMIVDTTGGVPALLAMGWAHDEADRDYLFLPKGVQMSMKEVGHFVGTVDNAGTLCICLPSQNYSLLQVRAIEESKDRLKKQVSYQSRMSKASALPGTSDKAAIRTQMEADRLERASRGPVTQGSTAQALPSGANVTTAGDLGLNSGGCC